MKKFYILVAVLFLIEQSPIYGQQLFGNQHELEAKDLIVSFHAGDMDNDGDLDLVSGSTALVWYENMDGHGVFANSVVIEDSLPPLSSGPFSSPGYYFIVKPGDLNGDGSTDIVFQSSEEIAWYKNTLEGGSFQEKIVLLDSSFLDVELLDLADLDGDNDLDLIFSRDVRRMPVGWRTEIVWLENLNGLGLMSQPLPIIEDGDYVSIGDIDNDEDIDIVLEVSESYGDNELVWIENMDSRGTFEDVHHILNEGELDSQLGDIDNDGDLDLVFSLVDDFDYDGENTIAWSENLDGNGSFSDYKVITNRFFRPWFTVLQDLDNDGDLDLISSAEDEENEPDENKIAWFENEDGSGRFSAQKVIDTDFDVWELFSADIDGNGYADIIASGILEGDTTLIIYENLQETSVSTEQPGMASKQTVHGPYPNPFSNKTTMRFSVPDGQDVEVHVYDQLGRQVAHLYSGFVSPDTFHTVSFQPGNLAAGVYMIHILGDSFSDTRSVVFMP